MSINLESYQGVTVPMVTPLTADGKIDEISALKLLNFFMDNGTIPFILGTTGEAASISLKERHKLIQMIIDSKHDKVPVIVGMLGLTVSDIIKEANRFFKAGIDAIVVTLPYHYELTDIQIYNYYKTIADQIEGNIILYNIPKTVHQSIPVDIIEELSCQENIIGVKDSELNKERLIQSLKLWKNRKDFYHFTGVNALMPEGLELGSKGIVPGTANFAPQLYNELYLACINGMKDEAKKIFQKTVLLSQMYQKGKTLGNSLAALKFVMSEKELCSCHVMPPLTELSDDEKERIKVLISEIGWI